MIETVLVIYVSLDVTRKRGEEDGASLPLAFDDKNEKRRSHIIHF
jgi:hypothetical protein